MDEARLAAVWAAARMGSGYLIGRHLVLTSLHVVTSQEDRPLPEILVRIGPLRPSDGKPQAGQWRGARLVWWDDTADVALIKLAEPARHVRASAVRWGQIRVADRFRYTGLAFPAFANPNPDSYGVEQLSGMINPLSYPGGQPDFFHLDQDSAPDRTGPQTRWKGASGGAIFCEDALIGVVTRLPGTHGDRRLTAVRADRLLRDRRFVQLVADDCGAAPVPEIVPQRPVDDADLDDVLVRMAPRELVGRKGALGLLSQFCAGPDQFLWLTGPSWSGKTALVSWFARHARPPGLQVAAFPVTRRTGEEPTRDAYTRSMIRQLARIAGKRMPSWAGSDGAERLWLLTEQAAAAAAECWPGGSLLLIVDGLDQDLAADEQRIAPLLPYRLPPGARLLVTSTTVPGRGLPANHRAHPAYPDSPVRWQVLQLEPWPDAGNYQARLMADLRYWLDPDRDRSACREILGLLAVAGAGLTTDELVELAYGGPGTPRDRDELSHAIRAMGQMLATSRREITGERVHVFAHDTLLVAARDSLAAARGRHLGQFHAMVQRYRQAGWPDSTPRYLLTGYPGTLVEPEDMDQLVALVTDTRRHDRLRRLTGTDERGLSELREAGASTVGAMAMHALLAIERNRLVRRNQAIPMDLPAVWTLLDQTEHGVTLTSCMPNQNRRRIALVRLVEAVPNLDEAVRIAQRFAEPELQMLAMAVAGGRAGDIGLIAAAARIHKTITDPRLGRDGHDRLLIASAQATPDMIEEMICPDVRLFARVLPDVIKAMSERDPARAVRMALLARDVFLREASAPEQGTRWEALQALDGICESLLRVSPADALETSRLGGAVAALNGARIPGTTLLVDHQQCQLEVKAATALADPVRGQALRPELEEAVHRAAAAGDAAVLWAVGPALAALDPGRAEQLATLMFAASQGRSLMAVMVAAEGKSDGISFASSLTETEAQARALTEVARAVALRAPGEAKRLASLAEDEVFGSRALLPALLARACATSAAATAPVAAELAWQTARDITVPSWRAWALASTVFALARQDQDRAGVLLADAEHAATTLADLADRGRILAILIEAAGQASPAQASRLTKLVWQVGTRMRKAAGWDGWLKMREKRVKVLAAAARSAALASRAAPARHSRVLAAHARTLSKAAQLDCTWSDERRTVGDPRADTDAELLAVTARAVAAFDPAWALELVQPAVTAATTHYSLNGPPAPLYSIADNGDMADTVTLALADGPYEYAKIGIWLSDDEPHTPWEADALADVAIELAAAPDARQYRAPALELADLAAAVAWQLPRADLRAASLAAAAEALASLRDHRAAVLADQARQLCTPDTILAGRTAVRLATAAVRSGHAEIRRLAMLATRTALSGEHWVDAIPALGLLDPHGMPVVCEVISAHAAATQPVPGPPDLL
jgi:hypothetical protein